MRLKTQSVKTNLKYRFRDRLYDFIPQSFLKVRWQGRFKQYWVGSHERKLIELLSDHTKMAIDIGAAEGIFSYILADLFEKVVAFEPNKHQFRKLKVTAKANVTAINSGISSESGTAELFVPIKDGLRLDSWGGLGFHQDASCPGERYTIDVKTLDSFKFTNISLIKIDVEGHEDSVIASASETISREQPALYMEVEQRHRQRPISDLVVCLGELGYDGFFQSGGRIKPFADFSVHRYQQEGGAEYVNNFLFLPKNRDDLRSKLNYEITGNSER